jgi:DNA-binding PadR family transcriptional regulator
MEECSLELSRIEVVLLTVVADKPSYAYEIDQFITCSQMRRWVRIGSASVYTGLERLAKKGYAVAKEEREGKMPTRYRYSITEEGKAALEQSVRTLLSVDEDHFLDLNLGIFCSSCLPRQGIAAHLAERVEAIGERIGNLKGFLRQAEARPEPEWREAAILETLLQFAKSEKKLLERTIAQLTTR